MGCKSLCKNVKLCYTVVLIYKPIQFFFVVEKNKVWATNFIPPISFQNESSHIKITNIKQKMILLDGEVARNFLAMFRSWFFLFLRFVLETYGWYKICSSDFALSNNKKCKWFKNHHYGITEFDIFRNDFCIAC